MKKVYNIYDISNQDGVYVQTVTKEIKPSGYAASTTATESATTCIYNHTNKEL